MDIIRYFECRYCGLILDEEDTEFELLDYHRSTADGDYARCIQCKNEGSIIIEKVDN